MLAHHDVLQRCHLAEQADVLEGPRDSEPGDLGRQHPGDLPALEPDGSGRGPIDAGDGVEQRGLARPVRTDQPDDLVLVGMEVDLVDGDEAAEGLGQLRGLDPRAAQLPSSDTPPVPVQPRPCCRGLISSSTRRDPRGPADGRP